MWLDHRGAQRLEQAPGLDPAGAGGDVDDQARGTILVHLQELLCGCIDRSAIAFGHLQNVEEHPGVFKHLEEEPHTLPLTLEAAAEVALDRRWPPSIAGSVEPGHGHGFLRVWVAEMHLEELAPFNAREK
jgi:hypothetical protein